MKNFIALHQNFSNHRRLTKCCVFLISNGPRGGIVLKCEDIGTTVSESNTFTVLLMMSKIGHVF